MSEQEIKEQISIHAREWWKNNDGPDCDPEGVYEDSFIEGCNHQDKIATNRTVAAGIHAIKCVMYPNGSASNLAECYNSALRKAIEELEKLRRV